MTTQNLTKVKEAIASAKHIAVMGHKKGDGDCFGAMIALKLGLEKIGKDVTILTDQGLPGSLEFLYQYFNFRFRDKLPEACDLFITVDCSEEGITSFPEYITSARNKNIPIVQIDHHVLGGLSKTADVSWVDTNACAACELIYRLFEGLDVRLDKNIATALMTGIETDTSSFQNQNTTGECLGIASKLMSYGARHGVIARESSGTLEFETLKLWGLALDRLTFNDKYKTAYTYLSYKDAEKMGLTKASFSGIVNFLNSIKNTKMIVLITEETPGTINVSLRTRDEDVDVSKLAQLLGGGGHVKAAGFSFGGHLYISNRGVRII